MAAERNLAAAAEVLLSFGGASLLLQASHGRREGPFSGGLVFFHSVLSV